MLYLVQLRGSTGGADEDFFSVKSWAFESEDETLTADAFSGESVQPGRLADLGERITEAMLAADENTAGFYVHVDKVEHVVGAAVEPELTFVPLVLAEMRRSGYLDDEEEPEGKLSEFDPRWKAPLPIPGIRE